MSSVSIGVIDWWDRPLVVVVVPWSFSLYLLLLTGSIAGHACRSPGAFFLFVVTRTHVGTHSDLCMLDGLFHQYCKSRICRTLSIFVSWALRPFVRMKFSYSCWLLQILWLAMYLSHAFYIHTETAAYEIYENNMHTKYSGFTVFFFFWCMRIWVMAQWDASFSRTVAFFERATVNTYSHMSRDCLYGSRAGNPSLECFMQMKPFLPSFKRALDCCLALMSSAH